MGRAETQPLQAMHKHLTWDGRICARGIRAALPPAVRCQRGCALRRGVRRRGHAGARGAQGARGVGRAVARRAHLQAQGQRREARCAEGQRVLGAWLADRRVCSGRGMLGIRWSAAKPGIPGARKWRAGGRTPDAAVGAVGAGGGQARHAARREVADGGVGVGHQAQGLLERARVVCRRERGITLPRGITAWFRSGGRKCTMWYA